MGVRSQSSTTCPRKLAPGQVKRVPLRGALVGYHVACPGCRFTRAYLKEEAGFVEAAGDNGAVEIVALERPLHCLVCRKRIDIGVDGLVAS